MIRGLVQGVGFRPFVYRLARSHGLYGEVDNRTDGVYVMIQGDLKTIDAFSNDLLRHAPPASVIRSIEISKTRFPGYTSFEITGSKSFDSQITEISPDISVCDECLEDLEKDPGRIDYPLINCTNCGPRFTIIKELPYDRANTTMNGFSMCGNCSSEYNDISDRRFHAQPIACNDCGPVYTYKDSLKTLYVMKEILKEASLIIASGKAIAVKGVGGYHLMCDALNNQAVSELRLNKQRDKKPFAVMFRDITAAKKHCFISLEEEHELKSWRKPILILKQKEVLSDAVSNGLNSIGAMLPYMPFHYLLFNRLRTSAVVLTSGNMSDEPVITDDIIAERQLMKITGSLISYNRQIFNRTDDSVVRFIDGNKTLFRRSRGFVPGPVDLGINAEGIIALGAEEKNSICFGKGNQAVISQYIGDLKNPFTLDFFNDTIERLSVLLKFKPELICCDQHPDYFSSIHAEFLSDEFKKPVLRIQHHHAHIASCMAEHGIDESVIGIGMDGSGYGNDEMIWGSEFMTADLKEFRRFTHFDYVPMPGGEKAISEPWRMAFSYIYTYFGDNFDYESLPLFNSIDRKKLSLIKEMIVKKINTPLTSGAGRIFDAVAAILGLCKYATFSSEAPIRLEAAIDSDTDESYPFTIDKTIIFSETLKAILKDIPHRNAGVISAKFHNTIAKVILEVSRKIRNETSLSRVILSGGVFQNKYLTEKSADLLRRNRFKVFTNHLVPVNDGGISLGQLIIASKSRI